MAKRSLDSFMSGLDALLLDDGQEDAAQVELTRGSDGLISGASRGDKSFRVVRNSAGRATGIEDA